MNTTPKILVTIWTFLILYWLCFGLQRILEFGVDVLFLNAGISLLISAASVYVLWNQQLNFNILLKYAGICWAIGFILGIIYIQIFDPHNAQGIMLSILWTAPFGSLIGIAISVFRQKKSLSTA